MLIEKKIWNSEIKQIHATGGGSYKYKNLFVEKFPESTLVHHDEIKSLVDGMSFVVENCEDSSYTLDKEKNQIATPDQERSLFPRILVSIGSGVSIIKVLDYGKFERVAGTMIGGGTLLGLANLMTGINDFDTIVEKAS